MKATVIYPKSDDWKEPERMFFLDTDVEDGSTLGSLEDVWTKMQRIRGTPNELPEIFKSRSMMVGDIVAIAGRWFVCDSWGWSEAEQGTAKEWRKINVRDRSMGIKWCCEKGLIQGTFTEVI